MRMAARAFSWLSGVTPAQQALSTAIGSSGSAHLADSTFVITQISVQSPTNSAEVRLSSYLRYCTSSSEPNEGLSKIRAPVVSNAGSISQPGVFSMQWGTGRFFPSCVCK